MQPRPDTPQAIRQSIWHHLTRAPHDRHHPWRTPVLATTTPDGEPNARTVVLRAANATQQTLTAFTDHRSAKAFELAQHPQALFVFWSDRLKWQLRVRALVTVQTNGPECQWSSNNPHLWHLNFPHPSHARSIRWSRNSNA